MNPQTGMSLVASKGFFSPITKTRNHNETTTTDSALPANRGRSTRPRGCRDSATATKAAMTKSTMTKSSDSTRLFAATSQWSNSPNAARPPAILPTAKSSLSIIGMRSLTISAMGNANRSKPAKIPNNVMFILWLI